MKKSSIRFKITLWFAGALFFIVALTFGVILLVGVSVLQKTTCNMLMTTVENNVDEIEYFDNFSIIENDHDNDYYIDYENGYLEVDDDFLKQVDQNYTALYCEDGTMLYGENAIPEQCQKIAFVDSEIQTVTVGGVKFYIYDRKLVQSGLEKLWLRGVASEDRGVEQMSVIVRISLVLLPFLGLLAVLGGYFIAGRMLRPIHNIAMAASEIEKGGDLKKRISLGEGKDELHQLAESFNDMFCRLDEAFMAEQQFTSDASHELRTPVSVIMAQCEYTLEAPKSPQEYQEAFYVIQRQGKKMAKLINDMLVFTRLESGGKNDTFEKVDMTELVSTVCQDMSLIREKDIAVEWNVQNHVYVEGNKELLTRLLANLISNGYRYGTEKGFIRVCLKEGEEQIELSVSDNGIGIEKEEQKKIFHRFYKADTSRNGQGTGLGLSMVLEIAQLHGGKVEVQSTPGKGSTFTIFLPKGKIE